MNSALATSTSRHPGLADALYRLAGGRDADAWGSLLSLAGADIARLSRRLTGDSALADDAIQETLLQVRDCAKNFRTQDADADCAARRWILRVAANTSLHLLRSRRRERNRDEAYGLNALGMSATVEPD